MDLILNDSDTEKAAKDDENILDLREEFSKIILPFHFTSTTSLLDVMMLSGSIISGSGALSLVFPGHLTPECLDFIAPSKGAAWLIQHLDDHGYRITPIFESKHDDYDRDGLVVLSYAHPVSAKLIKLIIFGEGHFVDHITRFYSTLLMNYVAWYGLVSLYPEWTTNKKGLITKNSAEARLTFRKLRDFDFTLSTNNGSLMELPAVHVCKAGYDCPRTRRSLLDEECAFQPFDDFKHNLEDYETAATWTLRVSCRLSGKSAKQR